MKNIKTELCIRVLTSGCVKPYDVIVHSYTDGGTRDLDRVIVSTNGIMPALTTRPDILGVVVDE